MTAELILLGAGASVEAGIPGSYDMTKEMLEKFSSDGDRQFAKVLQFVIGGLLFQHGINGENPYNGVNIEELFNAVILLGERQKSELSPFISSWHPQVIGLEGGKVDYLTTRGIVEAINKPIEDMVHKTSEAILRIIDRKESIFFFGQTKRIDASLSSQRLEGLLTNAIKQVLAGREGKIYSSTAETMIRRLVQMVWIKDEQKVKYLLPLIKYAKNSNSAFVTLNYDNTIEFAGKLLDIEVDTGFETWSETGEFGFIEGSLPLIKLHGSIDWKLSNGKINTEKPLPYQVIKRIDPTSEDPGQFRPEIIFGGKNKLTAKGPFLSLLQAFETQLTNCDVLTIIGYSLRDEHVNEFIGNWFNGDVSRRIRIINPNINSMENEFIKPLLNGFGKDRVEIIPEITSKGIQKIT